MTSSSCIKYTGLNKEVINNDEIIVYENKLFNAYPNPFNPTTIISYQIKESSFVNIKIYDMLGREINTIVNDFREKGNHHISFDAGNLASGTYMYSLEMEKHFETKIFKVVK